MTPCRKKKCDRQLTVLQTDGYRLTAPRASVRSRQPWIIISQQTELNGVFAATWTNKRSRPRLSFANRIEGTILQNVRQFFYPNNVKTVASGPRS
jgi:hypothetical protein